METRKKRRLRRPEDGNIEEMVGMFKVIVVGIIVFGLCSMVAIPIIKLIIR